MRHKGMLSRGGILSFSMLFIVLIVLSGPLLSSAADNENDTDLQAIINKANVGETIILTKGVYQGPIKITKPISLLGEDGVVIDGDSEDSVIYVAANDVKISGITIQHSGQEQEDSGVYLDNTDSVIVENNSFANVQYGIYVKNGQKNIIMNNTISSYESHFSKRGNGIHIFKGKENTISDNLIYEVQDGIYFDFANDVTVTGNEIRSSRYGMHYMFSQNIYTKGNTVEDNITGFMIMDSSKLQYYENLVKDQFHFRGYGILIYDTQDIILKENEIIQNSTGLSLEKAKNIRVMKNIIAANQTGLEFRMENNNNTFSENNFIANIVSSTIGNEELRLDDGRRGNYWDDYQSYDITGDGIGEVPYKAGSLYDHLIKRQPLWQFFFESPAILLWSKAESMFSSLGAVEVYDHKPLVTPVEWKQENTEDSKRSQLTMILAIVFLGGAGLLIYKGGRFK